MSNVLNSLFKKDIDLTYHEEEVDNTPLNLSIDKNIEYITTELGSSDDIVIKEIKLNKFHFAIIYIDGLVDKELVQRDIISQLINEFKDSKLKTSDITVQYIETIIPSGDIKDYNTFDVLFNSLFSGDTILLINNKLTGLKLGLRSWETRQIEQPTFESSSTGSKESFTETLRINTSVIRRRIKSKNLKIDTTRVGRETNTDVSIIYMNNIVNKKIVTEAKNRLSKIDIDGIVSISYIDRLLSDAPYSMFATTYVTERVDTVTKGLLDGRVLIIADGSPSVIILPAIFVHFLDSVDDIYIRPIFSWFYKTVRLISLFISIFLLPLYIAVTTFHHEMIPSKLIANIITQREGIPIPTFVEGLIMITAFEMIRVAALITPQKISTAITIVGALVLGDAVVQAGIISPIIIIVVAASVLTKFNIHHTNIRNTIVMYRYALIFLASFIGLFGITIGFFILLLHMSSIRSFGVPYTMPFTHFKWSEFINVIIPKPIWKQSKRMKLINDKNVYRQQPEDIAKPEPGEYYE